MSDSGSDSGSDAGSFGEIPSVFWGVELTPGQEFTTEPDFDLHVTQATLPANASDKGRTVVSISFPDEEKNPIAVSSLRLDSHDSQGLDLLLDGGRPVKFTVSGKNSVHLTGYFVPDNRGGFDDEDDYDDIDDEEVGELDGEDAESEDEEAEAEAAINAQLKKRKGGDESTAPQNGAPAAKKPKQDQHQHQQQKKENKPQPAEGQQQQQPQQQQQKREKQQKQEKVHDNKPQESKPQESKPQHQEKSHQDNKPQTPKSEKKPQQQKQKGQTPKN